MWTNENRGRRDRGRSRYPSDFADLRFRVATTKQPDIAVEQTPLPPERPGAVGSEVSSVGLDFKGERALQFRPSRILRAIQLLTASDALLPCTADIPRRIFSQDTPPHAELPQIG